MNRINSFLSKLQPRKHKTQKEIDNQSIIGTNSDLPKYRILPNLRFAYALPLVIIFAGFGIHSIFFSKAASTCTTTLNPGANIVSVLNSAASGSVICLNDGNYNGFRADAASTNKSNYVTLRSVNDKKAVFTSNLTFDNAKYIRLEGLKLNGGASFVPRGDHIELINNESLFTLYFFGDYRSTTSGCPCTLTNVTIKDNFIHDVHYEDPNDTKGQFGENGITGLSVSGFTVSGNTIKSVSGDYIQSSGIDDWTVDGNQFQGPSLRDTNPLEHQDLWQIFGCDFGCYGENGTTPNYHDNISFTNNVARNTGADTGLLFQTAYFRNPRIENNLFDAADRGGGYSAQIYNSQNLIFRNNTIINSPSGVVFRKGFDQTGTKAGIAGSGYQVDHNIFGIEGTLTGYNSPMSTESDVSSWGTFDYNVGYNEKTSSYGFLNRGTGLWAPNWVNTTDYEPLGLPYIAGYRNSSSTASSCSTKPGDTNNDSVVNITDIAEILKLYGQTNSTSCVDVNKDSVINIADIATVLQNYGTGSQISYLFNDEFNAASGAPPDTTKWTIHDEKCDAPADYSCPKNSNIFHDGNGNLVLRAKRETSNWLTGGLYSGSWLSTFRYGYGWPATGVKASTSVPFKIEMRALQPSTAGAWPSLWSMNTDRSTTQNNYELDISEQRMTFPTSAGCHQHTWLNGSDQAAWDGGVAVSDMSKNWHVYSANVYTDKVQYFVDGVSCGTAYGVSGSFGFILNNAIASPGSWGSGGGQPNSSDTGPWDFLIDYIRVTRL